MLTRSSRYLTVYTVSVFVGMGMAAFCVIYFVTGSLRAGKIIHEMLVASVMRTTLRWLDKTPTSRIIARCTEDIQACTLPLYRQLYAQLTCRHSG